MTILNDNTILSIINLLTDNIDKFEWVSFIDSYQLRISLTDDINDTFLITILNNHMNIIYKLHTFYISDDYGIEHQKQIKILFDKLYDFYHYKNEKIIENLFNKLNNTILNIIETN